MEQDIIKERVKFALKELEISVNALSEFRQLTRSTMNDQINGNSKIGIATIEALLAYRHDISAEWLLRGEGEMLRNADKSTEVNIKNTNHMGHHNNMGHHNSMNIGCATQAISPADYAHLQQQVEELKADKEKLYQLLLKQ